MIEELLLLQGVLEPIVLRYRNSWDKGKHY
jgi:hypothetical protein